MICSKQFTDLNLRLFAHSVKSCCKTDETDFTIEDMQEHGPMVFLKHRELVERRKTHLWENKLPDACNFCAKTEPNSMRKFWNKWPEPTRDSKREEIENTDHLFYFEIVSSTACDLACIYCNAENSSTWAKEMNIPIVKTDPEWKNQLVKNFYAYLEQKDYSNLPDGLVFSFSGGEPTYNNETFDLIENIVEIVKDKSDDINIHITSNFNTKPKQMDKFIKLVNDNPNIKWLFMASIDDLYDRNNAIRYRSEFDTCIDNLLKVNNSTANVVLMPSINVFSLPYIVEYIDYFTNLLSKDRYQNGWAFATNVIYGPDYLSPFMLGEDYESIIDEAIKKSLMINPAENMTYNAVHWIKHLENIKSNIAMNNNIDTWRKLKWFLEGVSARRGVDIADTFDHVKKIVDVLEDE